MFYRKKMLRIMNIFYEKKVPKYVIDYFAGTTGMILLNLFFLVYYPTHIFTASLSRVAKNQTNSPYQ